VNLFNAALALQQSSIASYCADGALPVRSGSAAPYSAPNQAFETRDGWIMIAAYMPERWTRLCELLGLRELATDPRFATSPQRVANRLELVALLTPVLKTKTTDEWLPLLQGADVLCSRVCGYDDLLRHPQLAANAMLAEARHPMHGTIRMPAFPVNSVESAGLPYRAAPACGEHTAAVLRDAGFGNAEVDELARAGAIRCAGASIERRSSVAAEQVV
jgi:crotonobetainyl-CoA:carnitine CoA-transferase CaiB-like acyl-CoA transferase